ncbi:hypothetical protein [Gordonia westfalica]|uniref:hypothetical protein n=1 Tax=Gordonia westfalica TaxID=158898 RepID=UPI001FCAC316|nr:hypothetical protein [Gordonia westfalica]
MCGRSPRRGHQHAVGDRTNELDIYIPSKNIAVEFNGLYWHSEDAGKDRHYHQRKCSGAPTRASRW